MIDRILTWKIELECDEHLVLKCDSGLIKSVPVYPDGYDYSVLIGWNIYSVLRHLFANLEIKNVYRLAGSHYNKLDKGKIKEIIANK